MPVLFLSPTLKSLTLLFVILSLLSSFPPEFQGIDQDVLVKVLKILESDGKAALLAADNGEVTGVKFLSVVG